MCIGIWGRCGERIENDGKVQKGSGLGWGGFSVEKKNNFSYNYFGVSSIKIGRCFSGYFFNRLRRKNKEF